jgi:hypothetical protein
VRLRYGVERNPEESSFNAPSELNALYFFLSGVFVVLEQTFFKPWGSRSWRCWASRVYSLTLTMEYTVVVEVVIIINT